MMWLLVKLFSRVNIKAYCHYYFINFCKGGKFFNLGTCNLKSLFFFLGVTLPQMLKVYIQHKDRVLDFGLTFVNSMVTKVPRMVSQSSLKTLFYIEIFNPIQNTT